MTNERKQDEQQEQHGVTITDLTSEQQLTAEQGEGVRGGAGKVAQQDFHFVMRNNTSSPKL